MIDWVAVMGRGSKKVEIHWFSATVKKCTTKTRTVSWPIGMATPV